MATYRTLAPSRGWSLISVHADGFRQCFGTDTDHACAEAWAIEHGGEIEPAAPVYVITPAHTR